MRPLIIVAAAVVPLVAVAISRIGQTLGQLDAIEAPLPPAAADAAADAPKLPSELALPQLATPTAEPAAADLRNEPAACAADEIEPAVAASNGGEHILRALAQDPDFMRAADELSQDPDPQTRQEARQLLRELGADEGTDLSCF